MEFWEHTVFSVPMGSSYIWLINAFEILAIAVLIACVVFLCQEKYSETETVHQS